MSLANILASYVALEPLDIQFSRIAKGLLKNFIEPLIALPARIIHCSEDSIGVNICLSAATDNEAGVISIFASLGHLLSQLRCHLIPPSTPSTISNLFFALLIPPIQTLIIKKVLLPSLPGSVDRDSIAKFHDLCTSVSSFEANFLCREKVASPDLQIWISNASTHWSKVIVEKAFARLRGDIAGAEYWSKSETVEIQLKDERDTDAWEALLRPNQLGTTKRASFPSNAAAFVQDPEVHEEVRDEWGLDEAQGRGLPSTPLVKSSTNESTPVYMDMDNTEDSGILGEDAWGFGADQDSLVSPSETPDLALPHGVKNGQNGHEDAGMDQAVAGEDVEGWGFEEKTPEGTPEERVTGKRHSRSVSLDKWDAWNQDESENASLAKPARLLPPAKLGIFKKLDGIARQVTEPSSEAMGILAKPPESFLISSKSKRILDISAEILDAALAVSNPE